MRTEENQVHVVKAQSSTKMNTSSAGFQRQQHDLSSWKDKLVAFAVASFILGIIAVILVVEVARDDSSPWADYEGHNCTEYCENSHMCDHTMEERPAVQQPYNAWSNLAYLFAGLIPITMIRCDISTIVYLITATLIGISSFMFHASLTEYWRALDSAFMFPYFATLTFHGIHAVFGVAWKWLAIPMVVMIFITPAVKPILDKAGLGSGILNSVQFFCIALMVAVLVVGRIFNTLLRKNLSVLKRTFLMARAMFLPCIPGIMYLTGIEVWKKDVSKTWCDPEGALQWHAVWHTLTAFASLFVWLYFDRNRLSDIRKERALLKESKTCKNKLSDNETSEGGTDIFASENSSGFPDASIDEERSESPEGSTSESLEAE